MKKEMNPANAQVRDATRDEIARDLSNMRETEKRRIGVLVHSCCGPCSVSVMERLSEDFDVTLFFYNPNITDAEEYERRLCAQRMAVEKYNAANFALGSVTLIVGRYEPERFFIAARGYEAEPEGGSRCERCFEFRLEKTVEYAALHGFERFTTTLSVSPHKDFATLARVGARLGMRYGLSFLAEDFKKRAGFARTVELSKAFGLYRQTYCGCEFSRRESGG
ncbi:MAG: epoxyqueuosine reductase QueH [Clostridiales Family XIII bacterium]|jgi:predicted adenine nucleotide alpha hydrolase (AANH) superfamily ATPase|nr:epoxyqueuosine reductase QueH [Clostridiales Family XIII bacterium]